MQTEIESLTKEQVSEKLRESGIPITSDSELVLWHHDTHGWCLDSLEM